MKSLTVPPLCYFPKHPLIIGAIYRSPANGLTTFQAVFNDLLHMLWSSKYNTIIRGDLNVDLLRNDSASISYTEACTSFGFKELSTLTRFGLTNSGALLDHNITNVNDIQLLHGIVACNTTK